MSHNEEPMTFTKNDFKLLLKAYMARDLVDKQVFVSAYSEAYFRRISEEKDNPKYKDIVLETGQKSFVNMPVFEQWLKDTSETRRKSNARYINQKHASLAEVGVLTK